MVFFHKAAQHENRSWIPWVGLSLVVSAVIMFVFEGGLAMMVVGQVALLPAIAAWRVWREDGSQKQVE